MPPFAGQHSWDVFCAVVDNYGDIGVCWRLAQQLVAEHGQQVRLWVDDLEAFRPLCPGLDPQQLVQHAQGVEIRRWESNFPETPPGDVVVEAFACHIPESFIAAMAQRTPRPVWINLDYLSAEDWVAGCHALPSPHPRLPLTKYFFFPGFTADTGGLLRESDLLARRQAFGANPAAQAQFWRELGFPLPPADTLRVSLFAYENPAIADLLYAWAAADTPVCCMLPVSRALPDAEVFCGQALKAGDRVQRGALEIRVLPFVEQSRYDCLLWTCDLNFVRGEDSFVRAQWAARPLVWHIYPQQESVHLAKLDAFLNIYCAELPEKAARPVRKFWHAWNAGRLPPGVWAEFAGELPALRLHAASWTNHLSAQEDLSSALVRFCRSKL